MLTASNFTQATHYMDVQKEPSETFMKLIMEENQIDEKHPPAPLKWGRKKAPTARLMYQKMLRREHFSMKEMERGFIFSKDYPCIG